MPKTEHFTRASFLPYKNLAVSLIFSLFFGPVGLLYSSVRGGIAMLVIAFIVLSSRFPVPIILMWVSCSIWSVMATNRYNNKLAEVWISHNNEEKNNSSIDSK